LRGRRPLRIIAFAVLATPAFFGGGNLRADTPVIFESGPGRFEVAAAEAPAARSVVAAADEAWRLLAGPLGLPPGFSSPIYVRVRPERADTAVTAPVFRAVAEPGGIVSLRLRAGASEAAMRRGLVEALLLRLAVARHGDAYRATAPPWLVAACDGWWRAQAEPAQRDAFRQESVARTPTALAALLQGKRAAFEARDGMADAFWLMAFLQAEANTGSGWHDFLNRLLGGDDPEVALAASYPGRFTNAAERELWWQTGWYSHRQERRLPIRDAAESRAIVADAARFVFVRDGREVVVPPADWRELARSADGRAALRAHAGRLARQVLALHPFYRNAGLSLARLLAAAETGPEDEFAAARAAFDADWRDGSELEAATARALDALEQAR
jgi:hypothetical protein